VPKERERYGPVPRRARRGGCLGGPGGRWLQCGGSFASVDGTHRRTGRSGGNRDGDEATQKMRKTVSHWTRW